MPALAEGYSLCSVSVFITKAEQFNKSNLVHVKHTEFTRWLVFTAALSDKNRVAEIHNGGHYKLALSKLDK